MARRGVSGFWLDIKALDSDRMHLVTQHGAKEGLLLFGVWVAIFTWQYKQASPITGPQHIANLTGLNIRTARRMLHSLANSMPNSFVHRSGQWYCKRTMQVLDKFEQKHKDSGATVDQQKRRDSDSDSDSDLDPPDTLSQDLGSGASVTSSSTESNLDLSREPPIGGSLRTDHSQKTAHGPRALKIADGKNGQEYPVDFDALWRIRPKRSGADPKRRALKAWNARTKDGHTAETMAAGMRRYAAYCQVEGIVGTPFVQQTATFLGPDCHFLEAWSPSTERRRDPPAMVGNAERLRRELGIADSDGVTLEGEYDAEETTERR